MANIAIKSLDHLVLTVRSIPATVAFYTNHLGMRHEKFTSPLNKTVERFEEVFYSIFHMANDSFQIRHALMFGSQKINLHEYKKEFLPKAQNVQPGSADLCFLAESDVADVLHALQKANIEVTV